MPDDELTRVTFLLLAESMAALDKSMQYEELSRTDVLNRAVQAYAMLTEARAAGDRIVTWKRDGTLKVWEWPE